MFQDVIKTVVMSAVSHIIESMGTLYFAIAATLIVAVCGFLLYKQFFAKSAVSEVVSKQAPDIIEPPLVQKERPQDREEAFAAAMQAEQEAAEVELQKRMANQQDANETTNEQEIEHVQ